MHCPRNGLSTSVIQGEWFRISKNWLLCRFEFSWRLRLIKKGIWIKSLDYLSENGPKFLKKFSQDMQIYVNSIFSFVYAFNTKWVIITIMYKRNLFILFVKTYPFPAKFSTIIQTNKQLYRQQGYRKYQHCLQFIW